MRVKPSSLLAYHVLVSLIYVLINTLLTIKRKNMRERSKREKLVSYVSLYVALVVFLVDKCTFFNVNIEVSVRNSSVYAIRNKTAIK